MLTATGHIVGTPMYMSPEQCASGPLDPRSDIYSFGILLYHMLTGVPPFHSESIYDLLEMQKTGKAESPRIHRGEIPEALEQIVLQCMEKDPARRPQRMEPISETLESTWNQLDARSATRLAATPQTAVPADAPADREIRRLARTQLTIDAAAVVCLLVGGITVAPQARALRGRLENWWSGHDRPEDGLESQIRENYRTLRRADELYGKGTKLAATGNVEGAYFFYRKAVRVYPRTPYLVSLSDAAPVAGRIDEARHLIRDYLSGKVAEDPDGVLRRWLEEHP
jgi:hypothetical protein